MSEKSISVFQDLDVAFEQRRKLFEFVGVVGGRVDRLETALCDGLRFALAETERAQRVLELPNRVGFLASGAGG
jgi:hypothetical protein